MAPTLLNLASIACRSDKVSPQAKDKIWKLSQHYFTYCDIKRVSTIGNGMQMLISSRPRVEQEILLFGESEPLFTRYLQNIPKNDDIFLDIGANIGYFSLVASKIFGRVHAIEASPSTFARFSEILASNKTSNIQAHNIAVGNTEGHIEFFQNGEQSGAGSTVRSENSTFEARVPVAPLEVILSDIDWSRVRFAKIDVEGLEAPVLDSLFALHTDLHPEVEIFCEFDPDREDVWPICAQFLENGFLAYMIQGSYDRRDYTDKNRQTTLDPISSPPGIFCDILLRRS